MCNQIFSHLGPAKFTHEVNYHTDHYSKLEIRDVYGMENIYSQSVRNLLVDFF